jgi:hypothetical protein
MRHRTRDLGYPIGHGKRVVGVRSESDRHANMDYWTAHPLIDGAERAELIDVPLQR